MVFHVHHACEKSQTEWIKADLSTDLAIGDYSIKVLHTAAQMRIKLEDKNKNWSVTNQEICLCFLKASFYVQTVFGNLVSVFPVAYSSVCCVPAYPQTGLLTIDIVKTANSAFEVCHNIKQLSLTA